MDSDDDSGGEEKVEPSAKRRKLQSTSNAPAVSSRPGPVSDVSLTLRGAPLLGQLLSLWPARALSSRVATPTGQATPVQIIQQLLSSEWLSQRQCAALLLSEWHRDLQRAVATRGRNSGTCVSAVDSTMTTTAIASLSQAMGNAAYDFRCVLLSELLMALLMRHGRDLAHHRSQVLSHAQSLLTSMQVGLYFAKAHTTTHSRASRELSNSVRHPCKER